MINIHRSYVIFLNIFPQAGFTAIQLVDNGETALWRHARIRSPFCEAGVFGDIMRQLLMKMAKCYPKVTSQVFASTDDVSRYIQEIPVFREGGKKEVLNRVSYRKGDFSFALLHVIHIFLLLVLLPNPLYPTSFLPSPNCLPHNPPPSSITLTCCC